MVEAKQKLRRIVTVQYLFGLAGRPHRDKGPAIIVRHDNGLVEEKYFRMGKLHRVDGPAIILKGARGNVLRTEFWLNGEKVDRRKVLKRPHITNPRPH